MKLYYCKIPKSIKLFGVLLNYDAKKCGGGGGGGGGGGINSYIRFH